MTQKPPQLIRVWYQTRKLSKSRSRIPAILIGHTGKTEFANILIPYVNSAGEISIRRKMTRNCTLHHRFDVIPEIDNQDVTELAVLYEPRRRRRYRGLLRLGVHSKSARDRCRSSSVKSRAKASGRTDS